MYDSKLEELLSSEEMLKDMVKELYYGEAIKIVTENQGSFIEPLPENPRPIDRLNTWDIEMLAVGLLKGIEMGIELMKEESVA